jgi:limonene-1,2-epoxide hydrolase
MSNQQRADGVIERCVDALQRADQDHYLSQFREDCRHWDPVGTTPEVGHDGLRSWWERVFGFVETYSYEIEHLVVCEDEAVAVINGKGRTGDLVLVFVVVWVVAVDDAGLIRTFKCYWDPDAVEAMP